MKNRILALLLCVCILVSWLPVTALAADDPAGTVATEVPDEDPQPTQTPPDPTETEPEPTETEPEPTEPEPTETSVVASGTCGDQVNWTLDSNGRMVISGEGPMTDSNESPWVDYQDQILTVRVEDGVTSIGECAFAGCTLLTTVEIADSVTKIGYRCFFHCENLTSIQLPDQISYIEAYAFAYCTSLTTVDLPASLSRINMGMFSFSGLVELEVPYGVTEIGNKAFEGCTNLETLILPPTVSGGHYSWHEDCPNMTIYVQENTRTHYFALESGFPFVILPDDPNEPRYSVSGYYSNGGTAAVSSTFSYAYRYIAIEAIPDAGYVLDGVYVYYDSEVELDLEFQQIDDTTFAFLMPACDVFIDVEFLLEKSPFVDVTDSDYFYYPVLWAVTNGITQGTDATHFSPNSTCTRAQVVTFLWRIAGEPEPQTRENPFTDIKPSDYYYKAVLWAVENGITNGTRNGKFSPNAGCTRGQVVTFLWRALGEPEPSSDYNPFVDLNPNEYYYDAVLWAVEYGVTNGVDYTHFAPNQTCTRGQIVTFLYRTFA